MSGEWSGKSDGAMFEIILNDEDGDVTGTGRLSRGTFESGLGVSGHRRGGPGLVATFELDSGADISFTGAYTGANTVLGWIEGGGFNQNQLTLTRLVSP